MTALSLLKDMPSVHDYDHLVDPSERPDDNMMFLGDVLALVKMCKSKWYKEIRDGKAPKSAEKKYQGKTVWKKNEVHAYWAKILAQYR